MTDREMLELAAKAAGLKFSWDGADRDIPETRESGTWNPLGFNDHAFCLAVKMRVFLDDGLRDRFCYLYGVELVDHEDEDATRRAITRLAAEIGKAMLETTS